MWLKPTQAGCPFLCGRPLRVALEVEGNTTILNGSGGGRSIAKALSIILLAMLFTALRATAASLNVDDFEREQKLGNQSEPMLSGQRKPTQEKISAPAQSTLYFSPWVKVCPTSQRPQIDDVCFTIAIGRLEAGAPAFSAALIEPKNVATKILRITVPLGVQLPTGIRLAFDKNPALTVPYIICENSGCVADYKSDASLIMQLEKSQRLFIEFMRRDGQVLNYVLPLVAFAGAYVSQPIDSAAFNAQQKKMQDDLQELANKKIRDHR